MDARTDMAAMALTKHAAAAMARAARITFRFLRIPSPDQSQPLNRNIPCRWTSRSPSIGIYPAPVSGRRVCRPLPSSLDTNTCPHLSAPWQCEQCFTWELYTSNTSSSVGFGGIALETPPTLAHGT
eukprot:1187797-Prorocentrum_minimum.AAC.1